MPPTFTTNYALAKPDPADAIDVTLLNANMDKLDAYIPVFANTSQRDTAYAAQPFKMCIVGASIDAGILQVVKAGKWVPVSQDLAWAVPVMSCSVAPPPTGTAVGAAVNAGGIVSASLNWTRGSTAGGNGYYTVNLPVAVDAAWAHTGFSIGTFVVNQTAGGSYLYGFVEALSATQGRFRVITNVGTPTALTYVGPAFVPLATNDVLFANISYKAA